MGGISSIRLAVRRAACGLEESVDAADHQREGRAAAEDRMRVGKCTHWSASD